MTRALRAYRKVDLSAVSPIRERLALPKRAKHLNTVELTRLVERYLAGATVYELADEFRIDRRTVSIRLKQGGVSMRLQPTPDEVVDEMVRLYASGLSLVAVGRATGFNDKTVLNHLRKRQVRTRDAQGNGRTSECS